MYYNTKNYPICKMALKLFCNAKTILVLSLILFCSTLIVAETSPNGYTYKNSIYYYSTFQQPTSGGYTPIDHICIQLNEDEDDVTPKTVQVNSDSLLIRTYLNNVDRGRYYIQFWINKKIEDEDEYVSMGSHLFFFIDKGQDFVAHKVYAPGNGSFTLAYRLFYEDGTYYRRGHHVFDKTSSQQIVMVNPNRDVLFKLRSAETSFKCPMLMVEGYDPLNSNGLVFYNERISDIERIKPDAFDGVDLYLLDFKDATIDLRENAMVVLGAIRFIKTLYPTDVFMEGMSVLGFSMGGEIARYALAYAEHNNIPHYCSQLISYDSPHRGAVINTVLQKRVQKLYNDLCTTSDVAQFVADYGLWLGPSGLLSSIVIDCTGTDDYLRKAVEELSLLVGALNSPASKQLLRYNVNSDEYTDELNGSIDYRDFYSEINLEERLVYEPSNVVLNHDANDPHCKPGYPYKQNGIKILAISNGGILRTGNPANNLDYVCKFNLPWIVPDRYVSKQNWDTQPGSSLGITSWLGGQNSDVTVYFDPVFVPLKSSLHLRPQGTNGYPDNPDLVINVYDDIIPRDNQNNIITDYIGIADYLANHSLFDSVVFSDEANLHHAEISPFVVTKAASYFTDPFNRAVSTISGNIHYTDLSGVEMTAYLGDLEHPLDDRFCKLNSDGSWSVAYTLLRDADVVVKFSKAGCLPTVKRYRMVYDNTSHSVNSIENQWITLYNFNLQNIVVSKNQAGSFGEVHDAVCFLADYFTHNTYNGEEIIIKVFSGTYFCPVDLSLLVAKGITNFTLEGVGEAIIKTRGYGIKLVVEEESNISGAVYNIDNIHITAGNGPRRDVRGIIYIDRFNDSAGDLPAPKITLNIQNCKIYDCYSYCPLETVDPVPCASAIHFEGAGSITGCDIHDNTVYGSDLAEDEDFQAGGLYVNNNTSSLVEISLNTFENNRGGIAGGVVAKGRGSILIKDNKFFDNIDCGWCSIANAGDANELSVYNASDIVIRNNLFRSTATEYGCIASLRTYVSQAALPIRFLNNTIINAPVGYTSSLSALKLWINAIALQDIHVKNNVISSTDGSVTILRNENGQNPQKISYNVFHNTNTVGFTPNLYNPNDPNSIYDPSVPNFNYHCDPELNATTYVPIWDETTMSPCIDNGEWLLTGRDPDGTPPDIGAYPAVNHRYWEYLFRAGDYDGPNYGSDTYHWVSYPVVNSFNQDRRVARSFFHELLGTHRNDNEVLVADVLQEILWYEGNEQRDIILSGGSWGPYIDTHHVASHQGYKIKLKPLDDNFDIVGLSHSGFLTSDTTPFTIYGSGYHHINDYQNWVGYFGTESVWPEDAFESIWDDLTMVKAKDWCLYRDPFSNINTLKGVMRPINPGDMVVVSTICDHQFSWNTSNYTDPIVKDKPIAFIYE
ncbi:MAG TPA: hypothetical protein PL126_07355, partial [Candidatus Cloacimonadota bacterium]|nr:hypothetical protein [Candidatus Cloacimonadota bacterium]